MTPAAVALCFLLRGTEATEEVLLGYKKTGFGTGKVVGIGGHLEAGETAAEAACREVAEEVFVTVHTAHLTAAGSVQFRFPFRPEWDMDCALFLTRSWNGEPAESSEIRPEWHRIRSLPRERMWPDAESWLPPMLDGEVFDTVVILADDNETVDRIERHPSHRPASTPS